MHPAMELVRYKPGEALRWLETGAQTRRRSAAEKGRSIVRSEPGSTWGGQIKKAAGAIVDIGKGAYTDLLHRRAQASEYLLHPDHFEVLGPNQALRIPYTEVLAIEQRGDRSVLTHEKGNVTIKPYAYIVSGRIRVPIGWSRNGMEVPFELLLEELSARCGVNLESL
jgi:hypothetical protein